MPPLPVPHDGAVAGFAVGQHARIPAGGIEQEHLGKLAAARIAREDQLRAAGLPRHLANRLPVERQLMARTSGKVHAVQVPHITETCVDVDALAVCGPGLENGIANILVAIEPVDDLCRDLRHVLHHEVAVVGRPRLDPACRDRRRERERQQHSPSEHVHYSLPRLSVAACLWNFLQSKPRAGP